MITLYYLPFLCLTCLIKYILYCFWRFILMEEERNMTLAEEVTDNDNIQVQDE